MVSYHKTDHVNLHFVIPESCKSENDVNDEMKMAFQDSLDADLSPEWITEDKCLKLSYTKVDVFVLQEFEGKAFTALRSTKSVVCGPICLRTCLTEGVTIPENNSPVYTTAMRDLSITASTTIQIKKKIKEKVGFMGGIYTSNLLEATTHLVSNTVRFAKYEKATEKGVTVMTEEWVDAVWEASLKRNVKATDPEFLKYKCKIFQDLHLACSNLSKDEKEKIKKLVTENGGVFTPQLNQNSTSLLVVSAPHGEKYKYATAWKLPCVYPSWILESVEKGYAVPTTKHLLSAEMKCSTPTSTDSTDFTLGVAEQFSLISHDVDKSHVNESALSNTSVLPHSSQATQRNSGVMKYKQILESIKITTVKRAGLFVDGCKVYLSGFSAQEIESLRRLLSLGGASIYNNLSETVSYVIVGDYVASDVKTISNMTRRPYVVSLEWLVASIKQKCPASGDVHSCLNQLNISAEPPSPLSQKGLQLLQPAEGVKGDQKLQISQPVSRKLFKDFAKPAEDCKSQRDCNRSENVTLNSQSQSQSQILQFYKDSTFKLYLDEDELLEEMEKVITKCGGSVVGPRFKGVPDYSIVPIDGDVRHVTATEIVTYLWVEDCYDNEQCVDVEYYHQPFTVDTTKTPLAGYCLGFTGYTGKERMFLNLLGTALGAICQDVFARKSNAAKGVHTSTHLITPFPTGSKYEAAVKWHIPAVSKDWLLACAKTGTKVTEEPYVVTNERNGEQKKTVLPESYETTDEKLMGPPIVSNATPSPVIRPVGIKTSVEPLNISRTPLATPKPVESAGCSTYTQSPIGPPSCSRISSKTGNKITPGKRKSLCTPEMDSDVSPFHMDTPDTPYGEVFGTPSKSTKKGWNRFLDNLGRFAVESPEVKRRRESTPMSVLRQQIWRECFNIHNREDQSSSSSNRNMTIASPKILDEKENCEPVHNTPRHSNRSESSVPLEEIKKSDSPTRIPEPVPSTSNTTEDHVTEHLERLGAQLANHTPPESTMKRYQDLNTLPAPVNTPLNPSTSKQISKSGVIDSQPITIDWADPVEAAERLKSIEQRGLNQAETPVRRFIIGSELDVVKSSKIVKDLGGVLITEHVFDSSTTHMVVKNPVRSEKFLCCLAAGKWVLHSNYLEECKKAEKWLPEEDFEYGNPRSVDNIPDFSEGSSGVFAKAAYRWRSKLKEGEGAYSGMKILLMNISEQKKQSFERLIAAGKGIVVDKTCLKEATLCCMEPWAGAVPDFVKELVKNKIPCVQIIFLGEYLYKDPRPPLKDHILPYLKQQYHDEDLKSYNFNCK